MPRRSFGRSLFALALVCASPAGRAWPQPTTRLVTVPATGAAADGDSLFTAISDDGRFVAFSTSATNIIPGDANEDVPDVAVRDLEAGETILVSKSTQGAQGNGASTFPSLSGDGLRVVFQSQATNLVEPDENGNTSDIFLQDRAAGTTVLVSVGSPGLQGPGSQANGASTTPSLSHNGRFVVFLSTATNLAGDLALEPGVWNVYRRDTQAGTTVLASADAGGKPLASDAANPSISSDGHFVVFATGAALIATDRNDLSDVYLKDVESGAVTLVSRGLRGGAAAGASDAPALDAGATRVAFSSTAGNLVDGVESTFRRIYAMDLADGTIRLISRSSSGEPGDEASTVPSLSPDGGFIAFVSEAANLVPGDRNGVSDVFLHELATGRTTRVSLGDGPIEADRACDAGFRAVARDGGRVAFRTKAGELIGGGPPDGRANIFARTVAPDTMAPALACSEDLVRECTGANGVVIEFAPAADDDVDPHPAVACEPASGSLFPPGITSVLCVARDFAGNESQCGFTVRVTDERAPEVTCPGNITARLPRGKESMRVEFSPPRAADSCDGDLPLACEPASGSSFGIGRTTVSCRAEDSSGNDASCQFTVRVIDVTAPEVDCPGNITVDCTGPEGTRVTYETSVSDDIDDAPRLTCTPASGSLFPIGSTEVTCIAEDDSGNDASCSFTVRVRDRTAPVITCPEPIRVPCTGASGSPVRFSLSAEDACDPDPTIDCSRDSGDTFPAGETIVECSATDASGNRTTCEFAVVVASDDPFFFRGDANRDNTVNVSDSIFILVHLFVGRAAPACLDAADVDDNGALNLSDAVFLLGFLFQGGPSPPPPGADQPGEDASPDDLGCSAPVC